MTTQTKNLASLKPPAAGPTAAERGAKPGKTSTSAGYRPKSWTDIIANPRELLPWLALLSCFPALGLIAVLVYGLAVGGAAVIAVGFMLAGGAFTIGALLGFLFGVPRALTGATQEAGLRSNTNLEQISDWLTKILVGVGLVEIGRLASSGEVARIVVELR